MTTFCLDIFRLSYRKKSSVSYFFCLASTLVATDSIHVKGMIPGRTEGNMFKRHDIDLGDVLVVACLATLIFGMIF